MTERLTEKPTRERVYDLLMNARQADWVEISLEDGRRVEGAIIFNEFKGTGRLINVEKEISFDFNVDQVVDVRM
ncbi:MAG: hypothetical protein AAF628_34290 [Planctomycetota bacterium]